VPCPDGATKVHSYVRVQLMHAKLTHEWKTKSRRGNPPRGNTGVDLVWDEKFQFSYESDELVFLR
jgi:phosphatidylinositol phospholipase C delta